MEDITNFILDGEVGDIGREVQKACNHKGIDFYKIEESLNDVLYEPDIRSINFLIIKGILGGQNVVSTKGRAYFDNYYKNHAEIWERLLFPFTRKDPGAIKDV